MPDAALQNAVICQPLSGLRSPQGAYGLYWVGPDRPRPVLEQPAPVEDPRVAVRLGYFGSDFERVVHQPKPIAWRRVLAVSCVVLLLAPLTAVILVAALAWAWVFGE